MQTEALKNIHNIRSYLDYAERHILHIANAWKQFVDVDRKSQQAGDGTALADDFIYWRIHDHIKHHDMSKFSVQEFIQYAEWFHGPYGNKYDLWDDGGEGDRKHGAAKAAFNQAWEHHKKHNPHHWENWTNSVQKYPNEHYVHFICMFIDWLAMSYEFGDTPESYYKKNKNRIHLPEWAERELDVLFDRFHKHTIK